MRVGPITAPPEGTPVWVWIALAVFVLLSGVLIAVVELLRRSRAETAAAEKGTREVLEGLKAGVAIVDRSWKYTFVNGEGERLLGAAHGQLAGSDARRSGLDPAVVERLELAMTRGESADLEVRSKDSEGWLFVRTFRARDGAAMFFFDVTEVKRREADRRLLAAIVDSTDDAIVSKDLTGKILSWNRSAERTFGYPADEAIGQSIAMLMPKQGADDFLSIIERIRQGHRVEHYETLRRRKDGTIIEVSLTVSPVHDENGVVIGASKIARDITAVRAAERERQRIRDLYLGILGHDLRNPLNTIVASLYTLERKVPPELQHIFPRISRSAERMGRMINQLLDFTRARLGEGIRLQRRPARLRQICAAVIEELEPQYPGRIRFSADEELESDWDEDRLAQALSNLIVNALDYGSREHPVDVRLSAEDGNARLEVSNRGVPIPEELRPEIFEPFRRGTGDEQRNRRGLGLGLFITREIVRAHGGTIELVSGQGCTTFLLRLPLAAVEQRLV